MADLFPGIAGIASKGLTILIWVIIIVVVIALVIGFLIWNFKRKKWNMKVGIKLPRGNVLTLAEIAKGHYDVVAGIVDIKRKGVQAVGMKPFDVREYLQGENYLEVMQLSPNHYIPIHPDSYKVIKDKDGNEHVVVSIKTDLGGRKVWKTYMERAAKDRFTIKGFLDKHWRAIEISIIMFVLFLGFSIMWIRLPAICT